MVVCGGGRADRGNVHIMTAETLLIGALVGFLVGLTGLGGGVVLLPLLIMVLGVPPLEAVGSAALFAALTKVFAGWAHWRQGTVDRKLVGWLAVGSVPAAIVGLMVLKHISVTLDGGIEGLLVRWVAVLLIVVPVASVLVTLLHGGSGPALRPFVPRLISARTGAIIIGAIGGLLVGLTSIGSGSVIMLLLIQFFNRKPSALVGTDIVHACILLTVTSAGHLALGTIRPGLVLVLLIGSLPAAVLGARVARVVPVRWLQAVLMTILVVVGVLML